MAEPAAARTPQSTIFFELDRFEHLDGGRLEVSGRWFGVRGRRFVRPTLTLRADGERIRALAELDDKPWPADEGEDWKAAFMWDGEGEIEDVELAVAPDLAVRLPRPGSEIESPERLVTYGAGERREAGRPQVVRPARPPARGAAAGRAAERRPSARERERERERQRELERLRDELGRSQAALAQAEALRAELMSESGRLTELESALREAEADAEAARHAERVMVAEREAALAERDAALAERDRLRLERDRAVGERDWLATQRDELLAEHDRPLERSHPLPSPPASAGIADPDPNWVQRGVALTLLIAALITLGIVLHVL